MHGYAFNKLHNIIRLQVRWHIVESGKEGQAAPEEVALYLFILFRYKIIHSEATRYTYCTYVIISYF
jgi:hypothetical protein